MRVALDSNVMIYAEGIASEPRRGVALALLQAIHALDLVIPLQAAGELRRWLVSKAGLPKTEAVERSNLWIAKYPTQATNMDVFLTAGELMASHGLQVWDSIVLAAAWTGGAEVLLSEDMQDGFKWRGVTVANPFADKPLPVIQAILNSAEK